MIYNFHFYDPHEFTHQGAGWGEAWWSYTHGIPYPATEASMQELLQEVPDAANRFDTGELLARPLGCAPHPPADRRGGGLGTGQ